MSERIKLLVYIHNSDTKAKQKTKDDNDQTKQREREKKTLSLRWLLYSTPLVSVINNELTALV